MLGEERVLTSRSFVAGLDIYDLKFDPEAMAERWESCKEDSELQQWSIDPAVMERFEISVAGREPGVEEVVQKVLA